MDSTSTSITTDIADKLKLSFQNINLDQEYNIPAKIWKVIYLNKLGIEYTFHGLIPISKIIKISPDKLFSMIINNSNNLTDGDFIISYDGNRKCININVSNQYLNCKLYKILNTSLEDEIITDHKRKILIDYSSPNIAKNMHVGHLRSTIIGDSIANLYELLGHEVHRINHIGDFGLQFGMLIEYYNETINRTNNNINDITIDDLQEFYAKSKIRFDNDDKFKESSYNNVAKLQQGDKEITNIWSTIKYISRQSYDIIYNKLNVKLIEVGESYYQSMIPDLITELDNKGLLIEEDGRKIIKCPKYKHVLTVVKSDTGYTYNTTDLAAIRYRLVDLQMDDIYYVVDVGQSLHFELIFEVARLAGWLTDQNVKHIGFGLVLDSKGKKFRSRDGDTVKLSSLLDEAIVKSTCVVNEKLANSKKEVTVAKNNINNIIETIAYGSVKYADLSQLRTNNYKFSFDKMLSLNGNTSEEKLYFSSDPFA